MCLIAIDAKFVTGIGSIEMRMKANIVNTNLGPLLRHQVIRSSSHRILSRCFRSEGRGAGSSGGKYGSVLLDRDRKDPVSLRVSGVPTGFKWWDREPERNKVAMLAHLCVLLRGYDELLQRWVSCLSKTSSFAPRFKKHIMTQQLHAITGFPPFPHKGTNYLRGEMTL